MKLNTLLLAIFLTTFGLWAHANTTSFISVEAEIYQLESASIEKSVSDLLSAADNDQIANILNNAELVKQPRLIAEQGQPATIKIADETQKTKVILVINSVVNSSEYSVDFELAAADMTRISSAQARLGSTLLLSSELAGQAQIVKITTRQFDNIDAAQAYITQSN